jgi:hypothetical protein
MPANKHSTFFSNLLIARLLLPGTTLGSLLTWVYELVDI